ncbi:glycerate kinase [Phycicoccus sp. BSK3Z-2]|uniref:Glycerate kinase n=1 Tax=Phycicoccus avicenniae TaxID=2828860 RepID=A0A941DB31_9MICO|nr:glycerate kinase [Phycicoccus avicenniae]MBR7744826.1 glycerate kinase [Phycicoccus avicenniae]
MSPADGGKRQPVLGPAAAPSRVVIAPNTFKGSLGALDVARAVAAGIAAVRPEVVLDLLPVADGGDGTIEAALAAGFESVPARVAGPTGEPVEARWARRGPEAVVEMAETCGLALLPGGVPAPRTATSRGLGEAVRAALDAGCAEVVLGIGGSASTDGGTGFLSALGARFLDVRGRPLPDGGAALAELDDVDLTGLHPGLGAARVVVACDVDNPLLGADGAAAVYGPQKGATPDQVPLLDAALARLAALVPDGDALAARPGAGAAGGVGFAALLLGAELAPGIDLVLDLVGFDAVVAGADLVVTGEGSLDAQSLHGKAPVGVATRAARHGVPVVAVCGRRDLPDADLRSVGIEAAHALVDVEPDVARCIADPVPLLERLGARLATDRLRAPR